MIDNPNEPEQDSVMNASKMKRLWVVLHNLSLKTVWLYSKTVMKQILQLRDDYTGNANIFIAYNLYTGGTFRAKKLSLKSLALSGLFGAKWSLPKKSFL